MAAVTVALNNVTRVNDADTIGTLWKNLALAKAAVAEGDFVYETTGSASNKVKTSEDGVAYYNSAASNNVTTNNQTWLPKMLVSTPGILNGTPSTSMIAEIGSGARANYYRYYLFTNTTYPAARSWLFPAINPNVSAWRDATVGTPSLTAVDFFALAATMTGSSKSENVAMDAIDLVDDGGGLILTGGDGASADGTFEDMRAWVEDTTTRRHALLFSTDGALFCLCTLTIGSATATVFTDANGAIYFPALRSDEGFQGLVWGLQSATNVHTLSSYSFFGLGQGYRKQFFDTTSSVNGTTEVITTEDPHEFLDGDAVIYSKEGGTAAIGLTDANEYFVNAITATTLSLHTTRQNAISDTSRVNLTASGTENHSLRRTPDVRPVETTLGSSGSAAFSNCNYIRFASVGPLNSKHTRTGCNYVGCGVIDIGSELTGSTLDGCNFSEATLTEGNSTSNPIAQVFTLDLDTIKNCTFTFNEVGHAVLIQDNTGSPFSYEGNNHVGYWSPTDGGAGARGWEFHTTNGVNGTTEVITTDNLHGFSTGDAVWYNKHGGTAAVGLTDGAKYYARALSTTTLSLHRSKNNANADTNRINLTASGAEQHSLYSNNAALCNNSAVAITVNITGGGDTPSVRNIGAATTTVQASVTVSVTATFGGIPVEGAAVYLKTSGGVVVLNGLTNASGVLSGSYAGTTPAAIDSTVSGVKASSDATPYEYFTLGGSIESGTGYAATALLVED